MCPSRTTKLFVLTAALLIITQFVALLHSVEHAFHNPTSSCQVFFTLEQSGNGLLATALPIINPVFTLPQSILLPIHRFSFPPSGYRARAPPTLP